MLVACPACGCHTRSADRDCAHCQTTLRPRGHLRVAATAGAIVLGLAGTAQAQDAPMYGVPSASPNEDALKAGRFDEACPGFDDIVALSPNVETHVNAGVCYKMWAEEPGPQDDVLVLFGKARAHFEQALAIERKAAEPTRIADLEKRVADVQQRMTQIEMERDLPRVEPTPVYGVPAVPRGGCGCDLAPARSDTSYGYGVLALMMLRLRRRR